jgi:hypothetical protein
VDSRCCLEAAVLAFVSGFVLPCLSTSHPGSPFLFRAFRIDTLSSYELTSSRFRIQMWVKNI